MGRRAEPWRRNGGDWYITHRGRQVRLAPASATKTQAWAALRELLAGRAEAAGITFGSAADLFLASRRSQADRGELSEARWLSYKHFLVDACDSFGDVEVSALKPKHVTAWLESRPTWGRTTRSNAGSACKTVVRWAKAEGHYDGEVPLQEMRLPSPRKRTRDKIPDAKLLEALRESRSDREWQDLIDVLAMTGCRPGEVYTLTAADIDFARGTMAVKNKTARSTGIERRTVYLAPAALEILARLAHRNPEGPVLRNTYGAKWTSGAVWRAMRKAGFKTFPYALRHSYGSRGIKEVDIAVLSKLMGHKRIKTTLDNYVHNLDDDAQMLESARKVSPSSHTPASGTPPDSSAGASPGPAIPKPSARRRPGNPPGGAPRS